MADPSLVSCIMIFLDARRFLPEAIESVLAQTYEHWELLLVDDGSSDGSTEVARSYAREAPGRIFYLEHPGHGNRGMAASRNLGIRKASGDYVAFLDADDVWLPGKLEQQVRILDANPETGMLYGDTLYWYSWKEDPDSPADFVPRLGVATDTPIPPPELLPSWLRGRAAVPCTCSILVRASVVEEVGGFAESFTRVANMYEDQAFYSKLCLKTPIMASDVVWDRYRQHRDASTAQSLRMGWEAEARRYFLSWLRGLLADEGVEDARVWEALNKELWLSRCPSWLPWLDHTQRLLRWSKKWMLRVEEALVPASVRSRAWSRFPGGHGPRDPSGGQTR